MVKPTNPPPPARATAEPCLVRYYGLRHCLWDVPIYSPSKSLLDKWEAVVVDDAAYRIRSYFR